jgi:transglutaminase-like putative cysteine protease
MTDTPAKNKPISSPSDAAAIYILGVLYSWAVSWGIMSCTIIPFEPFILFLYCAVACALATVAFLSRFTMIAAAVIVAVIAATVFIVSLTSADGGLITYYINLIDFSTQYIEYTPAYGNGVMLHLVVFISLFTVIFTKAAFNYVLLLAFGCSMLALNIISGFFNTQAPIIIFLFAMLTLTVISLNRNTFRFRHAKPKGGERRIKGFSLVMLPLSLAIIMFAAAIPFNQKISLGELVDSYIMRPYQYINYMLSYMFEPKYFSFENTGFGSSDRLGGNINPNSDFVMNVRFENVNGNINYLSGAVKDTYTGYSWSNSEPEFNQSVRERYDEAVLAYYMGQWREMTLSVIEFLLRDDNAENFTTLCVDPDGWLYMGTIEADDGTLYLDFKNIEMVEMHGIEERTGQPITYMGVNFLGEEMTLTGTVAELERAHQTAGHFAFAVFLARDEMLTFAEQYIGYLLAQAINPPLVNPVIYSTATVDFKLRRTGTVFLPGNFVKFNTSEYRRAFNMVRLRANSAGSIQSAGLMPVNTVYAMDFFLPDMNESGAMLPAGSVLAASKPGFYREMREYLHEILIGSALERLYGIRPDILSLNILDEYAGGYSMQEHNLIQTLDEILIPYSEGIFQRYTQLPDSLPLRVSQLAHEITKNHVTDYNKVTALVRYLSAFPYTFSPGSVPEGRDFVDYFLFDSEGQQGYCVYYATALAVMARSIGLPARYMEGYVTFGRDSGNGEWHEVTNALAHAWVEVYFEGYGWRTFEATPAYYAHSPEYLRTLPPAQPPQLAPYDPGNFEDPDDPFQSEARRTVPPAVDGNEPADPNGGGGIFLAAAFISLVTAIIACVVYVKHLIRVHHINKLNRGARDSAVYGYFKLILRFAKFWDYEMLPHETPNGYATRVGDEISFNDEKMFMRDIAKILTKSLYSGKAVSEGELDVVRGAFREFDERVKNDMNWVRYMVYRYALGVL